MRDGATQKCILYSIADVCSSHTTLNSAGRNVTFPYQPTCDYLLPSAWYRLTADSGSYLPESCPQPQNDVCGTQYPGWLNGIHPTAAEGVVARTVCFSTIAACCTYSETIEVKNCGDFYVYKLVPMPTCYSRYCVTNVGEYVSKSSLIFILTRAIGAYGVGVCGCMLITPTGFTLLYSTEIFKLSLICR